ADARREDRFADLLRRQTTDRAFEHRLKLVKIAFPVVFSQRGDRVSGDFVSPFAQLLGYASDQVFGDRSDVFTPLAQRLDGEAKLAQHFDQPVSYSIFRRAVGRIPLGSEDQPLAAALSAALAPPLFLKVDGEALLQKQLQAGQLINVDRPLLDSLD